MWLRCFGNPINNPAMAEKLIEIYKKKRKNSLYEAVMDLILQTNKKEFKEKTGMCQALEELFDEIMGEKLKEQVEAQVKEQVEAQVKEQVEVRVANELEVRGCKVKAETILEFLESYGEIPNELRTRVLSERDFGVLKKWSRLAAQTASVEAFQMAM